VYKPPGGRFLSNTGVEVYQCFEWETIFSLNLKIGVGGPWNGKILFLWFPEEKVGRVCLFWATGGWAREFLGRED